MYLFSSLTYLLSDRQVDLGGIIFSFGYQKLQGEAVILL